MRIKCEEANQDAPRVGCGCRACYGVRERSLDPRLLALAHDDSRTMTMQPARGIVYESLSHYLAGRMDYGALHLTIITALMALADSHFKQLMEFANRQDTPVRLIAQDQANLQNHTFPPDPSRISRL